MSTLDDLPESFDRAWEQWVMRNGRRWAWLVPGLVAGVCVYIAYLYAHDYPAFGAGLFLAMAEQAVEMFPVFPASVPHYTADGVPFAYPPLQLYVTGTILALTGLDGATVARHLPHIVSILALVPLYLFAEDLMESRCAAGIATLIAATAPPLLQWQISAGGIVRAPAYLFTVVGLYTGLRLFRDGDRRWIVPSLIVFGLTVLSHPVYTVFFVLSYLALYAAFDATVEGLLRGAVVGVGGLFLASPWWTQVIAHHGIGVLTGAAGTHGGIGKQLPELVTLFTAPRGDTTQAVLFATRPDLFDFSTPGMALLTLSSLAIVAAWLILVWEHRRVTFLTGWALLSVVLVSKPRFSFLIGSLMIGAVVDRHVLPALGRKAASPAERRFIQAADRDRLTTATRVAFGITVFVAATSTGVMYAGSQLDSHAGSTSQPAFIDDQDVDAMEWTVSNTDQDATFAVLGDAAEWFPYRTDRTIVVGPWGVEWRGSEQYQAQLSAFNRLSTCESATCVSVHLHRKRLTPDYLYVPRGDYTVRGMETTAPVSLERELVASDRYDLVYGNRGVLIFSFEDKPFPPVRERGYPITASESWDSDLNERMAVARI
jgi:hypothetical protein